MIGIYKITNKINGKCYIGQSVNIRRRWIEHRLVHRNFDAPILKRAFKKYGLENFSFEILEQCEMNLLNEREIFWISEFKPQYNRNAGGLGNSGYEVSSKTKDILRNKAKEQWQNYSPEIKQKILKNQLIGPRIGHEVSEETREKLRMANLGKKQSVETQQKKNETKRINKLNGRKHNWNPNSGHRKRIFCIELNMEFDTIKSASEFIGIDRTTIIRRLKKPQDSKVGFKPKYHFNYVIQ